MGERTIELEVLRYNPETDSEPHFQRYSVTCREEWVVLDALNHIKETIDPTLSYRWSCHMAVCGSCGMMINGEPKLACKAFIRNYEGVIRVEPLAHFPIERDLVTVIDDFMDKLKRVRPYIIPKQEKAVGDGEYLQTPAELKKFKQYTHVHQLHAVLRGLPGIRPDPEVHRPGGDRARAPLQPGFARRRPRPAAGGDRGDRGRLGMLLRRRLLRGLSGARRSGGRDPAGQDQEHGGLVHGAPDAMAEEMSRKPYVREMTSEWIFRHPRYLRYMTREFSCLFIGAWTLMLVCAIARLAEGPEAWAAFLEGLKSPLSVAFHLVALGVRGLPQRHLVQPRRRRRCPLQIGEKFVPDGVISGAHFAAWAVLSLAILYLAGAF